MSNIPEGGQRVITYLEYFGGTVHIEQWRNPIAEDTTDHCAILRISPGAIGARDMPTERAALESVYVQLMQILTDVHTMIQKADRS